VKGRSRVAEVAKIDPGRFPKMDLPLPVPYPPMEAKRAEAIPASGRWQFEPKWDGFRAIAFRDGDQVVLQSKAGQSLGRYFPEVVAALLKVKAKKFVLDGEIVIQVKGRLSFDDLLLRVHPAESRVLALAREIPAQYFVFDLLADGRTATADLPLEKRRAKLESFFGKNVSPGAGIQLSPATTDRKTAGRWFSDLGALGLDGVMAKRLDERYRSGEREGMVKVKHFRTADCVVGGFRYATGSRDIGSLLLGLYDGDGNLVFVGHTSSFNAAEKKTLKQAVEPLRGKNPFSVRVPGGPSRFGGGSGEWEAVKPKLVCEVEYDYYSQGRFRHGSKFLRWRPEKKPKACTLDQVEPAAGKSSLKKMGVTG
jgi:ATP-dependent DNA ligase